MNKIKKIIVSVFIFAFILVNAVTGTSVNAATASANGPVSSAYTASGGLIYTGAQIKAPDGTILFCLDSAKRYPNGNSYTLKETLENQGLWNLIRYGKSINANWAEISTGVHTYLAEQKGSTSYKINGGPTIKTSYAKQNAKVKKMVTYGKANNKLEKVTINKKNVKTVWNGTKKVNIVNNIKATGFSGNYKLTGVPSGVTFYKNNTNTKVNINSIPVNTVLELRANPSIDIKNAKINIKPLTATQMVGVYWDASSSSFQDLAGKYRVDPLTNTTFTLNSSKALVSVNGLKDMNDIDLYEQDITVNGKPYFKTKDGNPVMFRTETGELSISSILKNPSEKEFIEKDLYNKPYEYEYLDYEHLTKVVDKLDEQGNKIATKDENGQEPKIDDGTGNMIDNPVWIPTYEQETVNVTDEETGYPIVTAKKVDEDYVYDKATTSFNLGDKKTLDNIYQAQKKNNVEFTLYKADRKTVVKTVIVENGKFSFTGLNPNETYYAKETKTDEDKGFVLDPTFHKINGNAGQTIQLNDGKAIVNNIDYSIITLSKKEATGQVELDGAHLQLLDEKENIVGEGISKGGEDLEFKVQVGKYFIKETIAPVGYQKLTILIPVEVKETGEIVHVDVKNDLIKAHMKITKEDITGSKELAGAGLCVSSKDGKEFTITVDGKDIVTKKYCWTSTKKAKEFILYYGDYIMEETIAPKGYLKLKNVIPFSVTESGVQEHKVKNEPIKYTRTGGLSNNNNFIDEIKKALNTYNPVHAN